MNKINMEFEDFIILMKEVTKNLKKMNEAQTYMSWQFGEPEEYTSFAEEMSKADGWISSHC